MSFENIMSISSAAMDAQTARINLAASNVANADTVDSSPEKAFKAKRAVFKTVLEDQVYLGSNLVKGGVQVSGVKEDNTANTKRYEPNHPLANDEGFVFASNVNVMTEMVDVKAATRSFESAVEASNTAKRLMMRTIEMMQK
ncbi:MAG: flagellar basal body rod protein FlgC [Bacteroidetes bacterium]|nr:flagellar basal body rod protein FlgC [Bacteroidota bacterium]